MPQPTAAELAAKYTNVTAQMKVESSLTFEVYCFDARPKYGRVDVLVKPVKGTGERWVSSERLTDLRELPKDHARV
jgi:hypothetical protein